jgi:hypothetical protein
MNLATRFPSNCVSHNVSPTPLPTAQGPPRTFCTSVTTPPVVIRANMPARYPGAEYAGGKHATTIFHFSKWLLAEAFVLQYYPQTGNFSCMLLNGENTAIGVGKSVTQPAKRSLRVRRNQPQTPGPFPTGLHTRTRASRSRQRFRYHLHAREAARKRIVSASPVPKATPPSPEFVMRRAGSAALFPTDLHACARGATPGVSQRSPRARWT